jgi:hypothetical protein
MGRVLAVARVMVTPEHEEEYIRTVHALAELGAGRGQHLWLFRSGDTPGTFMEFSESRTEHSHRARASRTDMEAKLEARLMQLGRYAPGFRELWEEVPAPEPEPDDAAEAE